MAGEGVSWATSSGQILQPPRVYLSDLQPCHLWRAERSPPDHARYGDRKHAALAKANLVDFSFLGRYLPVLRGWADVARASAIRRS